MLVSIFESVDHTSQMEREACAQAFGFCAASHLDTVIEQLKRLTKRDMVTTNTFQAFICHGLTNHLKFD